MVREESRSITMNRRRFTGLGLAGVLAAGVVFWDGGLWRKKGKSKTDRQLKGMGYVVTFDLAPGASEKKALKGITDAGNQIISDGGLIARGWTNSYGGGSNMSFPRWVRVTWRENMEPGNDYWTTGTVVGDYTVEILNRIPEEVFEYAFAQRGRAIRLKFRIKDDGVLFAWDVQESSENNQGWVYKLVGGDFLDDMWKWPPPETP